MGGNVSLQTIYTMILSELTLGFLENLADLLEGPLEDTTGFGVLASQSKVTGVIRDQIMPLGRHLRL